LRKTNYSKLGVLRKIQNGISGGLSGLDNSIFKQASEGKLAPQDPNGDSSEIFLQKIKQQNS